jgi:hypothetical protein
MGVTVVSEKRGVPNLPVLRNKVDCVLVGKLDVALDSAQVFIL